MVLLSQFLANSRWGGDGSSGQPQRARDIGEPPDPDDFADDADDAQSHRDHGSTESARLTDQERERSCPDGHIVDNEPLRRPALGDEILDSRRRSPPHDGAVGFQPGQERNDLVELREHQPR
ncbi:hypothetical protein AC630_03065 [Bradyrhizobium sp. AS23.2]|nr:hypothetical protein AC630_03065 [Bradyrhizobium sp. AS23.2]